jgi:flagellar hook-basal body complex protein FliE
MLQTLRSHQSQAAGGIDADGNKVGGLNGLSGSQGPQGPSGFGDLVRQTVNKVNENQMNASKIASSYERGEGVPLTDVVLSMQKSSLSFEATLQVRNKVLKAYEDILNMPV